MKSSRQPPRSPASNPRVGRPQGGVGTAASLPRASGAEKLALAALWLLLVVVPFLVLRSGKESFRLPKLMAAEWLALASLLPLAWELARRGRLGWVDLGRNPAVRAVVPLLAVASLGLATTSHPFHAREALADLWIGAACLVGWSLALSAARLRQLLVGLLWPAMAVALLGIVQFYGVRLLPLAELKQGSRLTIISTAGNPGDLGAFLVLPCLIAQAELWRRWRAAPAEAAGRRLLLAAALAVCLYAIALTQTIAALAALLAGSLIFWGHALRPVPGTGPAAIKEAAGASNEAVSPSAKTAGASDPAAGPLRHRRARALALLAGVAALLALLVVAVPPLRSRTAQKLRQAASGDWNAVLTGRLDGWRAAVWMLGRHPWAGVGHGAYRAEFVPAKLALLDRGVAFLADQRLNFANAHNELLEVAADCGFPGLLALAWGLAILFGALRRGRESARGAGSAAVPPRAAARAATIRSAAGGEGALAWAGSAALAVLCLAAFPWRLALVAFPALFFLAWVMANGEPREAAGPPGPRANSRPSGAPRSPALAGLLLVAIAAVLVWQTFRASHRFLGNRLPLEVEAFVTQATAPGGGALLAGLPSVLQALRRAAALDPVQVEIPMAQGNLYLRVGHTGEALAAFQRAIALEPHPEIYFDIGHALLQAGRFDQARRSFALAVRLDPWLRVSVPPGVL
ncbi:MAG TPA: O-antigen ligase family protein [Thermoanaerobaculia bacterium]|nr:O-antigen ligase family protein [Thermoanaerobaculia bacterium]